MVVAYGHGSSDYCNVAGTASELFWVTTIILLEHTKSKRIPYDLVSYEFAQLGED
jgi:hypothetical protein